MKLLLSLKIYMKCASAYREENSKEQGGLVQSDASDSRRAAGGADVTSSQVRQE